MEAPLLLEAVARPGLIVHALAAMALLGAVTHQGVLAVAFLRGRFGRARLERVYVRIVAWLYPITFTLGALLYPTYRVRVRAEILDAAAPWASNAFDIKENLAALGLLLAVTLATTRPAFSPGPEEGRTRLHAIATLSLAALTWTQVILGLLVTAEEGL